jgi:cytochrome c oxidase subunit I+III
MIVLMLVAGSLFLAYVFSYLYLWTVSPQVWPPIASPALPAIKWAVLSGLLLLLSILAYVGAGRALPRPGERNGTMLALLLLATACLVGGVAVDLYSHWEVGLRPTASSYAAIVYMSGILTGQVALAVTVMTLFTVARYAAGKLDSERRVSFDNTSLLGRYGAAQGLCALLLIHGFPQAIG